MPKVLPKNVLLLLIIRLKNDEDNPGKLVVDPEAKLEEELIVRPTSRGNNLEYI
jgi:prolyl-tRNA synthetase